MRTSHATSPEQAREIADAIMSFPMPFTVTVSDRKIKRSVQQNALLHKWFGEIARHYGDRDMLGVKGQCHHQWGLPIKLRDPQWAWVWHKSGAQLPYEKQCAMLASGVLNVSSSMSVKELTEYMDAVAMKYRAEGVYLTDPELCGYREGAA
jgi:hypothetical protein